MTPHEKYTIKLALTLLEQETTDERSPVRVAVEMLEELLESSFQERPALYGSSADSLEIAPGKDSDKLNVRSYDLDSKAHRKFKVSLDGHEKSLFNEED